MASLLAIVGSELWLGPIVSTTRAIMPRTHRRPLIADNPNIVITGAESSMASCDSTIFLRALLRLSLMTPTLSLQAPKAAWRSAACPFPKGFAVLSAEGGVIWGNVTYCSSLPN